MVEIKGLQRVLSWVPFCGFHEGDSFLCCLNGAFGVVCGYSSMNTPCSEGKALEN